MHTPVTTRLHTLIHAADILVMPAAFDPISARLVQEAGFTAVQCSGLGISATHLGMPDVSILSMSDMVARTRAIVDAVDIPVMADGDTGFGNEVNTWYAVRAFEDAGAAGINLEDQILPKRCGQVEGKTLVSANEMVAKIRAAVDARRDPHFVINARTDALSLGGIEEAVARGTAYLEAGATMVFVEGIRSRDEVRELASRLHGPLATNIIEQGDGMQDVTFAELQSLGVARVSLSVSLLLGAIHGMRKALAHVIRTNGSVFDPAVHAPFADAHALSGMPHALELERRLMANKENA